MQSSFHLSMVVMASIWLTRPFASHWIIFWDSYGSIRSFKALIDASSTPTISISNGPRTSALQSWVQLALDWGCSENKEDVWVGARAGAQPFNVLRCRGGRLDTSSLSGIYKRRTIRCEYILIRFGCTRCRVLAQSDFPPLGLAGLFMLKMDPFF